MDKIKIVDIVDSVDGETRSHVIIDRGNGEFTSMPKAIYDAQQEAVANGNNI